MPVVAIEGCCHGQLKSIYQALPANVELLIICGDFQAIRNTTDFETISVPKKYRQLADFHRYYSGELQAPVLTVFVGGNHECSSYLQELTYGGWVAPNIYYLGDFGGLWYKGIRIGGLSGIYNYHSFIRNRLVDEKLPYDESTLRSVYHVKPKNFLKMCLMGDMDVCVSHDWPVGIEKHGNERWLVREKKWFRKDIENGTLGSPLNRYLLGHLRPKHWFAGHLHVRFEAKVVWDVDNEDGSTQAGEKVNRTSKGKEVASGEIELDTGETTPATGSKQADSTRNCNEITLDMDDVSSSTKKHHSPSNEIQLDMDDVPISQTVPSSSEIALDMDPASASPYYASTSEIPLDMDEPKKRSDGSAQFAPRKRPRHPKQPKTTRFLALDKCLPRRRFLEVMSIEGDPEHASCSHSGLYYDARAIAVNRVVGEYLRKHGANFQQINMQAVSKDPSRLQVVQELARLVDIETGAVTRQHSDAGLVVPANFQRVAPPSDTASEVPLQYWPNPQTHQYCARFGVVRPPWP